MEAEVLFQRYLWQWLSCALSCHLSKEKCIYSMWPIVVSFLNLPSHLRWLPGFLQLVGVIPGRSESKNTDSYLDILVDELSELNGSMVFDAYQNTMFSLKADIFLHILDYPGQNKVFHCNGECYLAIISPYLTCWQNSVIVVIVVEHRCIRVRFLIISNG